jgi:hypothetical protein
MDLSHIRGITQTMFDNRILKKICEDESRRKLEKTA